MLIYLKSCAANACKHEIMGAYGKRRFSCFVFILISSSNLHEFNDLLSHETYNNLISILKEYSLIRSSYHMSYCNVNFRSSYCSFSPLSAFLYVCSMFTWMRNISVSKITQISHIWRHEGFFYNFLILTKYQHIAKCRMSNVIQVQTTAPFYMC